MSAPRSTWPRWSPAGTTRGNAEFYKRLIENGKKPKVAIVACMRKMLIMLNAMIRDGAEWRGMPESA